MLARQQVFIDLENPKGEFENDIDDDEREILRELMSNVCSLILPVPHVVILKLGLDETQWQLPELGARA